MDWGDLRFVLEVARSGSALAASRALGVNQTTVIRRISQIECDLAERLFDRQRSGYRPTEAGLKAVASAELIEAEVLALVRQIEAEQRTVTGVVRVTTSETLANKLLTPAAARFQERHSGIAIQLVSEDRRLDIARGEADIAIRAGSRPEGSGIVARRMPDANWTLYCSRAYAERFGYPARREEIAAHTIIGMEGHMASLPPPAWLAASAPESSPRLRSNSLTNMVANLRAGLGIGMLPVFVGDEEPELMRCISRIPELDSELWLIVREEARNTPHVRAVADFLAEFIRGERGRLTGEA